MRGDNYDVLRQLPDECIDLIYLDPPFNSNQFYVAAFGDKSRVGRQLRDIWRWTAGTQRSFEDIDRQAFRSAAHKRLLDCLKGVRLQAGDTSDMAGYIVYMARRLMQMRRVLKRTGSIYLHCDPHANAYLRIPMDAIFGERNFRNEIVWQRAAGRAKGSQHAAKSYGSYTDSILYYTKSNASLFNGAFLPLSESELTEKFPHVDERGRYNTDVPLFCQPSMGARPNLCYEYKGIRNPHPSGWRVSKDKLTEMDRQGEIIWREGKRPLRKSYANRYKGKPVGSLWTDIPNITAGSERVGYPTQKPRALLERIIKASSNRGDLVMDPFCGCGTAADAAATLGRKYLGIDISGIAVRVMQQRLESRGEAVKPVVYGLEWTDFDWRQFEERALMSRDAAEDGTPGWEWAEDKVAALLNAVPNEVKMGTAAWTPATSAQWTSNARRASSFRFR